MDSMKKSSRHSIQSQPSLEMEVEGSSVSMIAKWTPFLCAGAALGLGILALKEIKSLKKDVSAFKNNAEGGSRESDGVALKKMEAMDIQIRKISQYLAAQSVTQCEPVTTNIGEIKNNIKKNIKASLGKNELGNNSVEPVKRVVNEEPVEEEESEYEEEEVTDDEN